MMAFPSASVFLDAVGELCTSNGTQSKGTLSIASGDYSLGMRDMSKALYTLTVTTQDFPSAKKGDEFSIRNKTLVVVRPPIVKNDTLILLCELK
jgi:hypothetical protein